MIAEPHTTSEPSRNATKLSAKEVFIMAVVIEDNQESAVGYDGPIFECLL